MHASKYLSFLIFLVACSSHEENTSYAFRQYIENGVAIAETVGGPKYSDPLFQYEPVLTLKKDPTKPESYLFNPGRILIDDDGLIYVADRGNQRIAVFNRDGEYLRSFGRKGEGPGEFLSMRLLYLHNDILNVYDFQNRRATLFRTDGTLLDIITPWDPYRSTRDIYHTFEGPRIHIVSAEDLREGGYDWNGREALIIGADNEKIATIATPRVATYYAVDFAGGYGSLRIEYAGSPVIQYYPNKGILITTGDEPVLYWYDLIGNLTGITRIKIEPEPVSDEERKAIQQRFDEHNEMTSERYPDMGRAERNVFNIREYKAFWDNAYMDDAGYVWLQLTEMTAVIQELGGPAFHVLSPEGEYLGNTRWPVVGLVVSGAIAQGYFLGCVADQETGERIPTIFQIIPSVEGLKYP